MAPNTKPVNGDISSKETSKTTLSSVSQSSHNITKGSSARPKQGKSKKAKALYRKHNYEFKNVTEDLTENEGKLELHLSKSAPTRKELREQIIRAREDERLRYFGVPIKMYDTDKPIDLSTIEYSEDDKAELEIYGSRVLMGKDGRVLGLEVNEELEATKKHKLKTFNICSCMDKQYPVSAGLKDDKRTRRVFMARVLLIESLAMRLPSIILLFSQYLVKIIFDFTYAHYKFVLLVAIVLLFIKKACLIYLEPPQLHRYRYIIGMISIGWYTAIFVWAVALTAKYTQDFVEVNQQEDAWALESLYEKRKIKFISFPYVYGGTFVNVTVFELILCSILLLQNYLMDELGNGFLLVITVTSIPICIMDYHLVSIFMSAFEPFDYCQMFIALLCSIKWTMYRFYELQRVTKGKIRPIDETQYTVVALSICLF